MARIVTLRTCCMYRLCIAGLLSSSSAIFTLDGRFDLSQQRRHYTSDSHKLLSCSVFADPDSMWPGVPYSRRGWQVRQVFINCKSIIEVSALVQSQVKRLLSVCRSEADTDALHQRPIQQGRHAGHGRQMQDPGCSCKWVCQRRGLFSSLHAAYPGAGGPDSQLCLLATVIVIEHLMFLGLGALGLALFRICCACMSMSNGKYAQAPCTRDLQTASDTSC